MSLPASPNSAESSDSLRQYQAVTDSLRESEGRFRKIVEHAPIAMAVVGMDGVIEYINRKAVRDFGYLPEDIPTMERWWAQAYPDEAYRNEVVKAWMGHVQDAVAADREITGGEYRVTCKDGTVKIMFIFGSPVAGKIFVMFDDITERKKAEEVQKQTASLLRATLESTADGLLVVDRAGKALIFNNKFGEQWQIPRRILDTGDDATLLHSILDQLKDPDGFLAKVKELYGMPEQESFDVIEFKDGRIFERFSKPQKIDGETVGRVWSFRDVTERRKAEAGLTAGEAKYRELSDTVPMGIFECDLDGRFTFVNRMGLEWFGYTEDDIQSGTHILDVIEPTDHARARENMVKCFHLPKPIPHEYRGRKKDGTVIQILISSRSLLKEGVPAGLRGIVLDLTEKKQLEALVQNAAKLESLGILAGGIAHDFNNLLGGIFGYLDLANKISSEEEARNYISKALGTIDRARGLTRQLLTFSKGGAPVRKLAPLFPFLRETVEFALSGSTVSCRFDVMAGLWACNYDMAQIGQAVDNIVINAQQAMPAGGTIDIAVKNVSFGSGEHSVLESGNYVRISIIDYGIGMTKEMLTHIFDPFFTTKTKGHGLGLATCFSIVSRHGGAVEADSEPGKGSVFHLYLPAVAGWSPPVAKEPSAPHRGNGRILVLDDEEFIRETLGEMLQAFGYSVVLMKNGREAADYFIQETRADHPFRAAFLDLTIPGSIGGKDVIREIRKFNSEMPVFVLSGYAEDPIMTGPAEYGFAASLCKPFRVEEVGELLNKYIGNLA